MDRWVTLMRHGEVAGGPRFRGASDGPVTAAGLRQMQTAAAAVFTTAPVPTLILSSPTGRCSDFARSLASERGLPLEIWDTLAERGLGDWEGRTAAEISAPELSHFWSDPIGFDPPGAEPFDAYRRRVLGAWREILDLSADHCLVVTHGGTIRLMLAGALGLVDPSGLTIEVSHACLTRLRLPDLPGRPSLAFHGSLFPGVLRST